MSKHFVAELDKQLESVRKLLIEKNEAYGNSALDPKRVFSSSDAIEQINVRIDDKLSRIANKALGEDSELDLIGYLVLKRIAVSQHQNRMQL